MNIPSVHLGFKGSRNEARARAYTMAEQPPIALQSTGDCEILIAQYRAVVDWFNVEDSKRWEPVDNKTYCNVYASDLVHTLGGYLPRVWWSNEAIEDFKQSKNPAPVYAETLFEQGANSLLGWLRQWGEHYGWELFEDYDEFCDELNDSCGFGVISARNRNRSRSGHITVAFPTLVSPDTIDSAGQTCVQSQAGTYNHNLFADDAWFESSRFDSRIFALLRNV